APTWIGSAIKTAAIKLRTKNSPSRLALSFKGIKHGFYQRSTVRVPAIVDKVGCLFRHQSYQVMLTCRIQPDSRYIVFKSPAFGHPGGAWLPKGIHQLG